MSVQTSASAKRNWKDIGRGFGALAGVLVLVVGVPAALIAWVGWPLPDELTGLDQVTGALRDRYIPDAFLIKALAIVCWLVWIELMASLIVEIVAYIRGRQAGRVPLAGGVQRAAARLVATVALLGALVGTKGLPTMVRQPLTPITSTAAVAVADAPQPAIEAPPAPAPLPVYEVQRRDTLWDISERHLGDPFRWVEIYELSKDLPQPDGRTLIDPDLIYPGWQVRLPPDAIGLAPPPAPAPTPAPAPAPAGGGNGDGGDNTAAPAPSGDEVTMVLLDDGSAGGAGSSVVVAPPTDATAPAGDPGGMVLLPVVAGGGQGPDSDPAADLAEPAADEADRSIGAATRISE